MVIGCGDWCYSGNSSLVIRWPVLLCDNMLAMYTWIYTKHLVGHTFPPKSSQTKSPLGVAANQRGDLESGDR